jgi:capsular polysaccharide transport system permease protein
MEPLALMAVLSALWYFMNRRQTAPFGNSILLFYSTGIFPYYFFVYVSRRMRLQPPNRRFPIERRLDHIFVHLVLRVFDYVVLGLVLFGGLYLFVTYEAFPDSFFPIVEAFLALLMIGFGWGLFLIALSKSFALWRYIHPSISRSLVLFTGVFHIPDLMPPQVREIMSFNPLVHAVTMFRSAFYPNYPTLLLDKTYLFGCSIFFLLMGLVLERITQPSESKRLPRRSS